MVAFNYPLTVPCLNLWQSSQHIESWTPKGCRHFDNRSSCHDRYLCPCGNLMEEGFIWTLALRVYRTPWQGKDCVMSPWGMWQQELDHICDLEVTRTGRHLVSGPASEGWLQRDSSIVPPWRNRYQIGFHQRTEGQEVNCFHPLSSYFHQSKPGCCVSLQMLPLA